MSRDIDSAVATAAEAEVVRPIVLAALAFDSGTVRVTSAPFDVSIDADDDGTVETYLGVGNLGQVGPVQESTELRATNVELALSGIPSEVLAIALGEQYQRRPARLWVVLLDAGHVPVGPAVQVFKGPIDVMAIERDIEATVRLTVESAMVSLEKPRTLRFTDADQQLLHPGDKGLAYVAQMVSKEIVWGTFAGKGSGIKPLVG